MKISDEFPNQNDAAEQVAKVLLDELEKEGLNLKNGNMHKRKRPSMRDEDDVYQSDEDGVVKSYEMLLQDLCKSQNSALPTFYYVPGNKGVFCVGSLLITATGKLETVTSLREHSKKSTAREDVCHDLYILLKSQPLLS